ncbi:MAG: hypothetical protein IPM07_23815 [Anaerolineales bacterium]|nr:hypothetical protein [Anaerolineales bacterium]
MTALPSPFEQSEPYPIPMAWLAHIRNPTALDVLEVLLLHSYDGDVIFGNLNEERWPQQDDHTRRLRALFGRQHYSKSKTDLIDSGLLRPFSREDQRLGKTQQARRELAQGFKYRWTRWQRTANALHRPRPYLRERWPAWLGDRDLGSRLVLLALLTPMLCGRLCDRVTPPAVIRRGRCEIYQFAETHFEHLHDLAYRQGKVNKGLRELSMLGLVEQEGNDCVLRLADLEQRPTWPAALVARACQMEKPSDAPLVELLRDLMDACCEPVTTLRPAAEDLRSASKSHFFGEQERRALRKRVRLSTRPGRLPHVREAIYSYKADLGRHAGRQLSGEFVLPLQETALATVTIDGKPLAMPVKHAHGINATQLLIQPIFKDDIPLDEVRACVAALEVLIWQRDVHGAPRVVLLPASAPGRLGVEFGYIVRANDLHPWLDYARPFEVIVKCERAEPRVHLHCVFRLLMSK